MPARLKITEASITSAICSKLRTIVVSYQPTGLERDLSLKALFSCIDPKWKSSLEQRIGPGLEWIAFPVQTPLFKDLKTEWDQVIPLKISFSRSRELSQNIFFRANNEIIPIQHIEQGILILQNLQKAIDEVRAEIERERGKAERLRSMIEGSAEPTIRALLKGSGLSYHIDFLPDTLELQVLLPYNRAVRFTIPYSKFGENITCLPRQIECIKQSINGFPYTLRRADYKVKWVEVD